MAGLTKDDAKYLTAYLAICDDFCGMGYMGAGPKISLGMARERLEKLNKAYAGKVQRTTLRKRFPAEGFALGGYRGEYLDEPVGSETAARCWMPSDLCYPPNIDNEVNYHG